MNIGDSNFVRQQLVYPRPRQATKIAWVNALLG